MAGSPETSSVIQQPDETVSSVVNGVIQYIIHIIRILEHVSDLNIKTMIEWGLSEIKTQVSNSSINYFCELIRNCNICCCIIKAISNQLMHLLLLQSCLVIWTYIYNLFYYTSALPMGFPTGLSLLQTDDKLYYDHRNNKMASIPDGANGPVNDRVDSGQTESVTLLKL